jgi:hypothetical protein
MASAGEGRSRQLVALPAHKAPAERIGSAILDLVGQVPDSALAAGGDPRHAAEALARVAANKAGLTAAGFALPVGPLGWLTVLPELLAVWRLQAQLVADIAAVFGQQANLGREQMIYCLFRHTAAQALRDLVARVGQRWLVRQVPLRTLQRVARAVGLSLSRRALGRGLSRWLPLVGAVGVGAYAYLDTRQVARTAIDLFEALASGAEPG